MPKRVRPQWGNVGAVRVRGAGQTDDQLAERILGSQGRGDRGCVFNDRQFAGIVEHLKISEPGLRAEVRGRLDTIREFYLKGRLYQAATPSQAERNAALAVVKEGVGAFLNVISAFGAPPEWS